jgi:hypothetical protein
MADVNGSILWATKEDLLASGREKIEKLKGLAYNVGGRVCDRVRQVASVIPSVGNALDPHLQKVSGKCADGGNKAKALQARSGLKRALVTWARGELIRFKIGEVVVDQRGLISKGCIKLAEMGVAVGPPLVSAAAQLSAGIGDAAPVVGEKALKVVVCLGDVAAEAATHVGPVAAEAATHVGPVVGKTAGFVWKLGRKGVEALPGAVKSSAVAVREWWQKPSHPLVIKLMSSQVMTKIKGSLQDAAVDKGVSSVVDKVVEDELDPLEKKAEEIGEKVKGLLRSALGDKAVEVTELTTDWVDAETTTCQNKAKGVIQDVKNTVSSCFKSCLHSSQSTVAHEEPNILSLKEITYW